MNNSKFRIAGTSYLDNEIKVYYLKNRNGGLMTPLKEKASVYKTYGGAVAGWQGTRRSYLSSYEWKIEEVENG